MSDIPESLVHYLAAWNETDPSKVRGHLNRSCAANVLFVDPMHTTRTIDDLEQMILAAREERPNASYHRTSGVDGHNLRYRYLWEVRNEGQTLVPGMDVATINDDGLLVQIDGFFGPIPDLDTTDS